MAKRFTDTNKWDKIWFRKLSPKLKCVWMFLVDRCDHAGVLDLDLESMSFFIGEEVSIQEIRSNFSEQITFLDDVKIVITEFIDYQYKNLNPKNRVHNSIINKINSLADKYKIKPLVRTFQGSMEKEEEKEEDNNKKEVKKKFDDFSDILSPAQVFDISLKNQSEFEQLSEFFSSPNVFGQKLPPELNRAKQKLFATIVHVYDKNLQDFKDHLTSIINENLAEEKTGVSRNEYILRRIKNKALELYNAT